MQETICILYTAKPLTFLPERSILFAKFKKILSAKKLYLVQKAEMRFHRELLKSMNKTLIIDGRNIYDAQEMKNLGFEYSCIGR